MASKFFDVFGDECAGDEHVSYGLVCVPSRYAAEAARKVREVKGKHGLAESALHCRVLFSTEQRRKAGLEHMRIAEVLSVYEDVAKVLRELDLQLVVGRVARSDIPTVLPAHGRWPRMLFDKKQLGVWCANAAMLPLVRDFGAENLRFWPDADETKIEWMGKRGAASAKIGMFYDLGAQEPYRIDPSPIAKMENDGRSSLFEIADLVAWFSCRAMSSSQSNLNPRLRALYRSLKLVEVTMSLNGEGHLGMIVPNKKLSFLKEYGASSVLKSSNL